GKVQRNKGVHVVVVCNFTPIPRPDYRIGVPRRSAYVEVINTDAEAYGGSGKGNLGRVGIEETPAHGFPQSVVLTLPPLATLWLVPELEEDPTSLEPESTGGIIPALTTSREAAEPEPPPALDAEQVEMDRSIAEESTL